MEQIVSYLNAELGLKLASAVQISIMVLVAFILGAISVWFNQNANISSNKRELKLLKGNLDSFKDDFRRLKSERDKLVKDLNSANIQNKKLLDDYSIAKRELLFLRQGKEGNIKTTSETDEQISQLKEEYSKLKSLTVMEQEIATKNLREARKEAYSYRAELNKLKKDFDELKKQESLLRDKAREEKIKLEVEKQNIKLTEREKFEKEKQKLLASIGEVAEKDKEDLKQIRGVGPFIEKKLHKIGVYTIQQVANFTKEDVKRATELIKYFPGRIERDNWIFQAKEILRVRIRSL